MSAALAGALATAKAANPGAKTAAAHAREGQATTARSKKWIGAASRRSAQAALKLRSRQARGKSRQARGKSRPVEAPCAPLPPSGFEPVAFAARGKQEGSVFATALFIAAGFAGRPTGGIYQPGWCCIAAPMPRPPHLASLACSWRMASLRSSYRCAVRWCWLRAAWASGASERAAWRWRCCWPSGARVALASQLACT